MLNTVLRCKHLSSNIQHSTFNIPQESAGSVWPCEVLESCANLSWMRNVLHSFPGIPPCRIPKRHDGGER